MKTSEKILELIDNKSQEPTSTDTMDIKLLRPPLESADSLHQNTRIISIHPPTTDRKIISAQCLSPYSCNPYEIQPHRRSHTTHRKGSIVLSSCFFTNPYDIKLLMTSYLLASKNQQYITVLSPSAKQIVWCAAQATHHTNCISRSGYFTVTAS